MLCLLVITSLFVFCQHVINLRVLQVIRLLWDTTTTELRNVVQEFLKVPLTPNAQEMIPVISAHSCSCSGGCQSVEGVGGSVWLGGARK